MVIEVSEGLRAYIRQQTKELVEPVLEKLRETERQLAEAQQQLIEAREAETTERLMRKAAEQELARMRQRLAEPVRRAES